MYVNDKRVAKALLIHEDVIRLGEVAIQIGLQDNNPDTSAKDIDQYEDTRANNPIPAKATPKKKTK